MASVNDLLGTGRLRMEVALASVDGRNDFWAATVDQAIRALAATGRAFTADDVHELGVPDPLSSAEWGPRWRSAARAGLLTRVGYTPSRRPSAKCRPIAVWRGTHPSAPDEEATG